MRARQQTNDKNGGVSLVTEHSSEFIEDIVGMLVLAFEDNQDHMYVPHVTDKGLKEMSDIFAKVPSVLRANVFISFLDELEDRGIKYDIEQIGRESCRERVCKSVYISVVAVRFKKKTTKQ